MCLLLHIQCSYNLNFCLYTSMLIHNLYEHTDLHFLLFEMHEGCSFRSIFCPKIIFCMSRFENEQQKKCPPHFTCQLQCVLYKISADISGCFNYVLANWKTWIHLFNLTVSVADRNYSLKSAGIWPLGLLSNALLKV